MDETDIPEDDLTIERAEPEDQEPRSTSLGGARDVYPVKLLLNREVTRTEVDYLKEKLGGRIGVEGSTVVIHDTTVEEIKENSTSIAERVRDASRLARQADRDRCAEDRKQAEAIEAERQRRQSIADEIAFPLIDDASDSDDG